MAFSKAARNGKHGGGARWRGRHARHSTAFHAITVVILLCFTVFHVELSVNARLLRYKSGYVCP